MTGLTMTELFASGRIVDAILVLVALEAAALLLWRRRTGRGPAPVPLLCNLASGAALMLAVPLVLTYLDTGLVPRLPTAILITGMTIVAVLCFFTGLILDTVTRGRREVRRLAYLAHHAPRAPL